MSTYLPPAPAVKDVPSRIAVATSKGVDIIPTLEALDADLDVLIDEDRREVRQYPDFSRGAGETWRHFTYRLCTEGHTFFDAWLLMAGAIGQVMLTTPNAWYKMGLIPGAAMIVWGTLIGIWTIIQFKAMYDDRKRDLIVEGEWFDDPSKPHNRRHKTQNQEMLGYYLGVWGVRTVAFMQFFGWFGTGAKQILSSSSLFYSINNKLSMRSWTILSGFLLLPFGLIPNFRKARVILIIGVLGTMFCGLFGILISAEKGFADAKYANLWPLKGKDLVFQPFFNGAAVMFSILDHNSIVAETIEAMQHPRKFFKAYCWGFWPLIFMIVPPGLLLNLAYAKTLGTASNFFQLAPMSNMKVAAVILMFLHNIQAYTLWMTAFGFMWEKIVGTHEKALWIRLASRVPALLLIFLFCVAFPFYEAVNSFMNGIFSPLLTYTVPCGIFWWHYRKEENRKRITYPHMRRVIEIFGWSGVAWINLLLVMYGLILVGFTSTMGVLQLVKLRQQATGLFPECFGCSAYV